MHRREAEAEPLLDALDLVGRQSRTERLAGVREQPVGVDGDVPGSPRRDLVPDDVRGPRAQAQTVGDSTAGA